MDDGGVAAVVHCQSTPISVSFMQQNKKGHFERYFSKRPWKITLKSIG